MLHALDYTAIELSPNAQDFIQSYSTNTLENPWNAFIDLKGKIVTTFYQKQLDDKRALLLFPKSALDRTHKHLKVYLNLTGTDWKQVSGYVYFDLSDDLSETSDIIRIPEKKGSVVFSHTASPSSVSEDEFIKFRLDNNIPFQDIDYTDPMLLNVSDRFVSFTKGCYLGQEIIARVHFRAKPPQRLLVVSFSDCNCDEKSLLTSIYRDDSGSAQGFLFCKT